MSTSNIVDIMLLRQKVNIGQEPDDNTGDPLRDAFNKINIDVDIIYELLSRLGLDRLPEDARLLTTADQIGSGNYALRNGNINEVFRALLFESVQGLVLGQNQNSRIFSSNVDQFGFILNGLESTFILNHHNNLPSLSFLVGNLSNNTGNSLLLGLNYFDNNTNLWYPAFSIYKSGKVQIGSLTLIDETGNIPYNRLNLITGNVPLEFNTLEKIATRLQEIISGGVGSSTTEVVAYNFDEPAIEWEISHNRLHKNYMFQVFDDDGNIMFPASRKETGILRLIFTETVTGECIITFRN